MLDHLHRHRLESRVVAGRFKRKAAAQYMRKVFAKARAHAKDRAERMACNANAKGDPRPSSGGFGRSKTNRRRKSYSRYGLANARRIRPNQMREQEP
jgi:hypothetical protein